MCIRDSYLENGLEQLRVEFSLRLILDGEPPPNWTRLRSTPRQRAGPFLLQARNPKAVGDHPQGPALGRKAQPWGRRASRARRGW
eukprot:11729993-Alexandrium_andersonii.AAC.1